jgi:hypothetical protein
MRDSLSMHFLRLASKESLKSSLLSMLAQGDGVEMQELYS